MNMTISDSKISDIITPKVGAYIKVEFDPLFTGGDYSGVGEFVFIPVSLVDAFCEESPEDFEGALGLAFTKVTKQDAMHIVNYVSDETYDHQGELIEV